MPPPEWGFDDEDGKPVPNEAELPPEGITTPGERSRAWRFAPWNEEAEESLVGAMLLSADGRRAALRACAATDLWKPDLAAIYAAVEAMHRDGRAVDPITVADEMIAAGEYTVTRQRLLELQGNTPASANAAEYGAIVARYARARAAMRLGSELMAAGRDADVETLDRLTTEARERLAPAAVPVVSHDLADLWDLAESEATAEDKTKPFVIPGCLRAGEVIAYTGAEGGGKSMWLRQLGVCVASGIHPMTGLSIGDGVERRRVLFVDLQEDEFDMADEVLKLKRGVEREYERGWYHAVPMREGLDLLSPRGRRIFEGLLEQHRPELVLMGPVVKTFRAPTGRSRYGEDVIDELTLFLDEWMTRYGFGLVLEGHAGNERSADEDWRIRGSSVWRSWPAFSHGLKVTAAPKGGREAEIIRARRDRYAERCWPTRLFGGTGWRLPWQVASGDYARVMRAVGLAHYLGESEQQAMGGSEPF